MANIEDKAGTEGSPAGWGWITALGIYLLVFATVTIYLAVKLWPDCDMDGLCDPIVFGFGSWALSTTDIDQDERLFWTAVTFGAIGSYVHVAASFSDYVGNRRLVASWIWWFLLRAPIGIALAVVFYVTIRAGFLTGGVGDASTKVVNPFGIAAMSAMAGMFSKQAADKLNEVFTTLFKTNVDEQRGDKLTPAAPKIESIVATRSGNLYSLAIKGIGFHSGATVTVNGAEFKPATATETEIAVVLTGLTLNTGDQVSVVVKNPAEAGGESAAFALTIT